MTRRSILKAVARTAPPLTLLALAAALYGAAAQTAGPVLHGVVLGPDGEAAAGVAVALHRITDAGGALVENATSDAAGRFVFSVTGADADAVYFVAARFDDELYIGPTFRPPFPEGGEYVVQVGVEEASASALLRGGEPVRVAPPPSPWRWALLGVITLGFLIVSALVARRIFGPTPRRRLLIRIAELDEQRAHTGNGSGSGDDDDEDYHAERERLFDRLRAAE